MSKCGLNRIVYIFLSLLRVVYNVSVHSVTASVLETTKLTLYARTRNRAIRVSDGLSLPSSSTNVTRPIAATAIKVEKNLITVHTQCRNRTTRTRGELMCINECVC